MSLQFLLDMNLSPEWTAYLQSAGFSAVHWSEVGAATATDQAIMDAANQHGQVVITQDLDFSILLALTHASGPSVVQIRARNSRPSNIGPKVLSALKQYETELRDGVLLTIDELQNRIRVLPILLKS